MKNMKEHRIFTRTHTHTEPHATETLAAVKAERSALPIKKHILHRLKEQPEGLTPDEFCDEINGLINTVRRRFTDLWKEGVIRHHPENRTRINDSKNECVVWVIGEDPRRKPSRHQQMQNEIIRLRHICRSHGIDPDQTELDIRYYG
tara:strand:+ start:1567 stop:2007 length:441 start_codon:yes stop_codon:yes gene_type:complete